MAVEPELNREDYRRGLYQLASALMPHHPPKVKIDPTARCHPGFNLEEDGCPESTKEVICRGLVYTEPIPEVIA